jgi:hypothetical protein
MLDYLQEFIKELDISIYLDQICTKRPSGGIAEYKWGYETKKLKPTGVGLQTTKAQCDTELPGAEPLDMYPSNYSEEPRTQI